jgi:hypothetical protein
LLLRSPARLAVIVGFVSLIALGGLVRYHGMRDAFVGFHSTRQYHCALIARGMYYRMALPPDEPRRRVAERAAERRLLEPPFTEAAVALGYWFSGGEHLRIARAFTATLWLLAAALLYRFAAQLLSAAAALGALAYFLFLPYGIVASQSFQPEALMLACMLAGWNALLEYHRRPSWRRLVLAGLIASLAILVKPVSVFSIAALHAALLDRNQSFWRGMRRADSWLLPAVILLPSALYYLPNMLGGGRLSGQADLSFQPELLATWDFWQHWKKMLFRATGDAPTLMAAAVGVLLARAGRARRSLIALWLSYLVYGMVFTYHISSHDYYQLPVLPVIGLSLAALVERLRWITRPRGTQLLRRRIGIAARAAMGMAALGLSYGVFEVIERDAFPRTHREPSTESVYREIGRQVQHSLHVVYLTPDAYGGPLMFYGELSGWYWPTRRDIHNAAKRGKGPFDPERRLDTLRSQQAEYFVSTPAAELQTQRKLRTLLRQNFAVTADTPDYTIFDLRR